MTVGKAASHQDGRIRDSSDELLGQAAFPHTSRTEDRNELTGTFVQRPLEHMIELPQLRVTAHEEIGTPRFNVPAELVKSTSRQAYGFGLALQAQGPGLLGVHLVTDEPVSAVAD